MVVVVVAMHVQAVFEPPQFTAAMDGDTCCLCQHHAACLNGQQEAADYNSGHEAAACD